MDVKLRDTDESWVVIHNNYHACYYGHYEYFSHDKFVLNFIPLHMHHSIIVFQVCLHYCKLVLYQLNENDLVLKQLFVL